MATPIGHLADITLRAIDTLKTVSLVACEDTRRTNILLHHLNIQKPLMRYDEHTHEQGCRRIIDVLGMGQSVALVTDAGTPTISDPGRRLVEEVIKKGQNVVPIPGPSALLAGLCASGLSGEGFIFLGFLPRKAGPAGRLLREALGLGKNVVIFESPFRVHATLSVIAGIGPDLHVVVARELTKIHEEFIRGSARDVTGRMDGKVVKGEVVIMIAPASE